LRGECSVCGEPEKALGFCGACYASWRKCVRMAFHGDGFKRWLWRMERFGTRAALFGKKTRKRRAA